MSQSFNHLEYLHLSVYSYFCLGALDCIHNGQVIHHFQQPRVQEHYPFYSPSSDLAKLTSLNTLSFELQEYMSTLILLLPVVRWLKNLPTVIITFYLVSHLLWCYCFIFSLLWLLQTCVFSLRPWLVFLSTHYQMFAVSL